MSHQPPVALTNPDPPQPGNGHSRIGPAKFTRPRTPAGLVAREAQIAFLNRHAATPLTLLVGPAGYGKSTLVSTWLSRSCIPHAWLFVDEHDADPTVFTRSIVEAVRRSSPELIPESIALLQDEHAPFQQLLSVFVEEISLAPAPYVLVIDDFHRAETPGTTAMLAMLLRSIGATPSIVIISRARPNLPLDELRAYGELAELGSDELRFDESQSRAVVEQSVDRVLPAEVVEEIIEQADGWVVGLRLLAASPEPARASPPGVDTTRSSILEPSVARYLFAEVIEQQPPDIQEFLLRTSLLEFLQPAFCDKLTARTDSDAVLASLAHQDLFIQLVDRQGGIYRYHPLFRDALMNRLKQSRSDEDVQSLFRVAAHEYEIAGDFEWATHFHILAGDWDAALAQVHEQAVDWMLNDQLSLLEQWTGRFPIEILFQDRLLTYCRAWVLVRLGRTYQCEEFVTLARQNIDVQDDTLLDLRLDSVIAYVHLLRYESQPGLRIVRRWLDDFPLPGTFEHLTFMVFECLFFFFDGQPIKASAFLEQIRAVIESTGRPWLDSLETGYRGRVLMETGENLRAKALFRQAVELGERSNAQPLHYAHLLLAQACLESLELRSARSNAIRCLELAYTLGTTVHSSPASQVLADVAMVRGDRHETDQHIQQAIAVARSSGLHGQLRDALARRAHYSISAGDPDSASQWATKLLAGELHLGDFQGYKEHSVLARYLISVGQVNEGLAIVDALLERARIDHRRRHEFEMIILRAWGMWRQGDQLGAMAQFRPALRRAIEHQWTYTLAQDVLPLSPMLEQISSDPELGTFARTILRERRDQLQAQVVLDSTGSPLTPRERDMLAGLLTGKSNRELADEMFISEYTVKRHLSNLYTKLGVSSRAQAIAFFANRVDD
ncbi:MAG: LuxR C-terminal-related transcriptional regulator [Thermomicrobiales bacterium]